MPKAPRWWIRLTAAPGAGGANSTARILPSASGKWRIRKLIPRKKINSVKSRRSIIMTWDAFINYASEDRIEVAQPLAKKLKEYGLKIWYDKFELRIGD